MTTIKLRPIVGDFAENKDSARTIRLQQIVPALGRGETVILDFEHITGATQSFVHALLSELFREHGADLLDQIKFKNCNEIVQKIITIVSEYMQESA